MTSPRVDTIVAYASHLSAAPGDRVACMVSCFGPTEFRARFVRVVHGDVNPDGPGPRYEPVPTVADQTVPGRVQAIHAGSFAVCPTDGSWDLADGLTLAANIWPTTPGNGRQSLMSIRGADGRSEVELGIGDEGDLELRVVDGTGTSFLAATGVPLLERHWYLVAASYDPRTRSVRLIQQPHDPVLRARAEFAFVRPVTDDLQAVLSGAVVLAGSDAGERRGRMVATHLYNGKLERPRLLGAAADGQQVHDLVSAPAGPGARAAGWDLAQDISSQAVRALPGRGRDGHLVNLPTRAVTGSNWTGQEMSWRHRSDEYGAVHFHDDDLYDAGWDVDFTVDLPPDLASGVYAIHLTSGDAEDHIPLFVRPGPGADRADVVFVVPTASYLAYANEHMVIDAPLVQLVTDQVSLLQPADLFLAEHREYGGSTYDTHSDGSGICYSSRLRPILNMRPGTGSWLGGSGSALWQFAADTHIVDWLTHQGLPFDVLTDEDVHAQGAAALEPYRVVVTGTHPEYTSHRMRGAYQAHVLDGGRLMYMGGNGFYWKISFLDDLPGVLEIRRTEDGTRTWAARPGEYHHASSGEYGGLWVRAGSSPQELVGVGFAAQGFDVSSYYERRPGSHDPRAAFIFDGVGDERIGDFGLIGGGAAGLEIDRHDVALGSPSHALVLASSVGHTDTYMLTLEEMLANRPTSSGTQDPSVRADLVFFETPRGGAVFSTGSIAWSGSLSHSGYDNNVARITGNVLARFVDPTPFPLPGIGAGQLDAPRVPAPPA